MQDIGDTIRRAFVLGGGGDVSRQLLSWLVAQIEGSRSDWDEGAGEAWGSVLVGNDAVVLLFMKAPIAIGILSNASEGLLDDLASRGVAVVRVESMESQVLCSDRAAITQLAGGALPDMFHHEIFSAEELWWATI